MRHRHTRQYLPFGDRLRDVSPVLVAHGTRNPHGVSVIAEIAEAVGKQVGTTRTAFVDVLGPTPAEVIADVDRPAVLVPAFLASGYHVRKDLPQHVEAAGRCDTIVTRALGPDPAIADVARLRLVEAGWEPGDSVVLAAAGSSDESACGQVHLAARQLESIIGGRVEVGFITTATPSVPEAVERASRNGRRVAIASYLLAPGLFHQRLHTYGADVVADPLGADQRIVDLIVTRMRAAISPYRRQAPVSG
ncbi:sirohydrochlorin chelatase [Gordonia sp. Z-3]|jgi:sirohydrochlorin ferrochelatase|uniref:Sirohydrochlorin chelatase n=1 Tax=Gordonia tangerina TaxID=2911060 RepID=A0ABS9DL42_9ACTN|nr:MULTISPECIES: sirohydrochlorin chelatase [Gordonia]MAU84747.1 cobalamin biosynthesis protein CbiX [Gordonia sp. (in: high G+C Gram-positive bacteria)]MCF3939872.1 sirohydrochlorin chelatase [Gordonia tangerina]MED5799711.1 sirohydrochlorin chelatase [Gordonia sp. Z-3]